MLSSGLITSNLNEYFTIENKYSTVWCS